MKEIYNCQPEHYLKTLAIKLGLNAVVIKHKNIADFSSGFSASYFVNPNILNNFSKLIKEARIQNTTLRAKRSPLCQTVETRLIGGWCCYVSVLYSCLKDGNSGVTSYWF